MLKYITSVCLFICLAAAKHELYDGHALYAISISNEEQGTFLGEMQFKYEMKILTSAPVGVDSTVLVAKMDRNAFENELNQHEIKFKVESENFKELLDQEDRLLAASRARANRTRSASGALPLDTVYTLEEVDEYLEELAAKYPDVVTLDISGKTIEGRDIKYLRISTSNFEDQSKPIVMIESLIHAREWITQSVTLYAIEKLVIDVTEKDLVEDIDWIIVPTVNPDGYAYSHSRDRMWRKNTRRGLMIFDWCFGVDLNRNFDSYWSEHAGHTVCWETYHGLSAMSEPETQAVDNIFQTYGSRIELFLDIHSAASMIIYSYGNGQLPPNALNTHLVGVNMAQAIDKVKWPANPNYVVGNIALALGYGTGGVSDWATTVGIPLAFAYELPRYYPDSTSYDVFLVNPEFISQAGYETWEGIKVGARSAAAMKKSRKNNTLW